MEKSNFPLTKEWIILQLYFLLEEVKDFYIVTRALRYKLFFVKALTKRLRKLTIIA